MSPIDLAARLAGKRGRVLLHSARDDDGLGRWSFATAMPSSTLIARGRSLVRLDATGRAVQRFTADPFDAAEAFLAEHGCTPQYAAGDPAPRVVGYFGYDLARVIESLPGGPTLGHDTPDLWLAAYDGVARWRGGGGGLGYELVGPDARALAAAIAAGPHHLGMPPRLGPLIADDDGGHHMARVERVRDYLAAGDVYQVNLARRLVARITSPGDPLALYAALVAASPAPYGAVIEADGLAIVSASPERFLATERGRLETRPIKGTRPPGPGGAAELAAAPKDAAEHLMIVDLERNDLGRVAETGTVSVDELGYVVELPTLFHKVSRVSARPRAGLGYAELLRATFPGGSITGAPKVRAMQLIDELEPARRGPYCGAFGYFAPTGFELAIAIRIGVIKGYELRVHVGGGIVTDSDPAAELAETDVKAAAWVTALDQLRAARR
ncbi:MAG TPA: anthranilate synthase component I family protein [Kofleriaceae bacterium]|nr:anthranilate synthase component I family protein [Kofleriaceae bacterium]